MDPAQLQAYQIWLANQTPPGALGDAFFGGAFHPGNFGLVPFTNTVTTLQAIPPPANGTPIDVLGYSAVGDGGPWGRFYYSSASTATPNGGTIIRPNSISGNNPGRWLLPQPKDGFVNLMDFGPVGQGNDDTAAFTAALATGHSVRVPDKTININTLTSTTTGFLTTTSVGLYLGGPVLSGGFTGQVIEGVSIGASIIQSTTTTGVLLNVTEESCGIRNIHFKNTKGNTNGWVVFFNSGVNSKNPNMFIENCWFDGVGGCVAWGDDCGRIYSNNLYIAPATGGLISIVDGTGSTDLALFYGFGTTGNAGPMFASNWLSGVGSYGLGVIFLLLDSQSNSSEYYNILMNFSDTNLICRQTLSNSGPNFNQFYNFQCQTPACTLYSNAAIQLLSGLDNDFYGMIFINAAGSYQGNKSYNSTANGIVIASTAGQCHFYGLEINGVNNIGMQIHGSNIGVHGGRIANSNNQNQNTNVANVVIYAQATDVIIDGLRNMGGNHVSYDILVSATNTGTILLGNNIYSAPVFVQDTGNAASIWPPVPGQLLTPTLALATPGSSSWSYATQECQIWQVGSLVYFHFIVTGTLTLGTGSGQLRVSLGIPAGLNSQAGWQGTQSIFLSSWQGITPTAGYTQLGGEFISGGGSIGIVQSGSASNIANVTSGNITAAVTLKGTGFYQQAAGL